MTPDQEARAAFEAWWDMTRGEGTSKRMRKSPWVPTGFYEAEEGWLAAVEWQRCQSAGAEVAQERIDDLMRKAGMQEIKDADYRSSMGQPMTVDEQSSLDAARRFAQLLVAASQEPAK